MTLPRLILPLLIAAACALSTTVTLQERALRIGSARAAEDDLFRLGTDEAYAQGYADGYDEGTAEASGPDVEDDE